MSGLSQLLPLPVLGQHFPTWNALKKNVQAWAVQEKFHFKITHKGKERVLYRCQGEQCHCRLRGSSTEEEDIEVTVLSAMHTSIAPLASRSVASNQEWLQAEIPRIMEVTRATKP